ncbi:MAG: DUF692 domain-containing protein [Gammaproteobacteria bacterium]|nr:DUF692 domain-containing protein [Gammaproteobacteria bacterium]MBT8110266.1 DUF692 domain-containing protein [Gammaproteobacteria bacterium]NND48186.1 DUF692 domain-containing protein [Woeseiaceae bacterium]NNL44969.1 DUF692 domain-containing protein [Woeseiaceae bacterium]
MIDSQSQYPVHGAGLGLRRPIVDELMANPPGDVDFMEVAPENWIHVGGALARKLRFFTERYPFLIHGLSLSIGAPSPLNEQLVRDVKEFMAEHNIRLYSEHLSFCGDDGQLYDLMPIPFTEEAVSYVAQRVRRVQDILEQRIALENVSFYAPIDTSMSEREFLLAVLEESDCDLMLDINNIVVNSINHCYDASDFLNAMPAERIRYFHLAGHHVEAEDLRIDTHGSAVDDQAWQLLQEAYSLFGPVPTLLERDFNFPPMDELMDEVRRIRQLQLATEKRQAANA